MPRRNEGQTRQSADSKCRELSWMKNIRNHLHFHPTLDVHSSSRSWRNYFLIDPLGRPFNSSYVTRFLQIQPIEKKSVKRKDEVLLVYYFNNVQPLISKRYLNFGLLFWNKFSESQIIKFLSHIQFQHSILFPQRQMPANFLYLKQFKKLFVP